MGPQRNKKHDAYFILLSATFVVGLGIGIALCIIWRYHPAVFSTQVRFAAIAICPPFLLVGILEATAETTLTLVMTIGTIIFANGFLYAGLASFSYFLVTVFLRKKGHSKP